MPAADTIVRVPIRCISSEMCEYERDNDSDERALSAIEYLRALVVEWDGRSRGRRVHGTIVGSAQPPAIYSVSWFGV